MKSWNELRELRASAAKEIALRNPGASAAAGPERLHVLVCAGTGCTSSSSALIMEQMQQQLTARGLDQEVRVIKTGCFGLCQKGPIVAVYPDKIFYCHVKPDDVGEIIDSIAGAEPIGPKRMFDVLIVVPCTGNTLAKLSHGITDTTAAMAVKSHLRSERPVVLALSTNDALAASAENIGRLLNRRHYYFVPFGQDDPESKPRSLVSELSLLPETMEAALEGRQLQPILVSF